MPDKNEANPRDEPEGGRAERLVPELIKRLIESVKFAEGKDMRHRVSDIKLPKEVLALLLSQLEDGKNGLYRALAKELRDFLEQTNFTDELVAALTKLTFEIRTEVRFVASDPGSRERVSPEVRAKVNVKRDRPSKPPSSEEPNPDPTSSSTRPGTNASTLPPQED